MNFYSDAPFCDAIAASYFPNQRLRQSLVRLNGQVWRIPTLEDGQPITNFPQASIFVDFFTALAPNSDLSSNNQPRNNQPRNNQPPNLEEEAASSSAPVLRYLPRVCHGLVIAEQWNAEAFEQNYEPAPTVFWNMVESWDEYHQIHKKVFADINRRQRKLAREIGPVSFLFDDPDPAALQTCMDWKSQQYRASGEVDVFASPHHVTFFRDMAQRGLIKVSSLRVGDRLIAANICATDQRCLYYWIPAYDAAFRHYSPGMLLLGFLLEESYKRGDQEFDFLIGGESYKWKFATHSRLIADMGIPPLSQRTLRAIKQVAKPIFLNVVNKSPRLKSRLKAAAHKLGAS